jgi:hypothetical protein
MVLTLGLHAAHAQTDTAPPSNAPTTLETTSIPVAAADAFTKSRPNVNDAKWFKNGEAYTAAYNESNERESRMTYDAEGKLLMSSRQVTVEDLPENIKAYVIDTYGETPTVKAFIYSVPDGKMGYEIDASGKLTTFDERGNLTSSR